MTLIFIRFVVLESGGMILVVATNLSSIHACTLFLSFVSVFHIPLRELRFEESRISTDGAWMSVMGVDRDELYALPLSSIGLPRRNSLFLLWWLISIILLSLFDFRNYFSGSNIPLISHLMEHRWITCFGVFQIRKSKYPAWFQRVVCIWTVTETGAQPICLLNFQWTVNKSLNKLWHYVHVNSLVAETRTAWLCCKTNVNLF